MLFSLLFRRPSAQTHSQQKQQRVIAAWSCIHTPTHATAPFFPTSDIHTIHRHSMKLFKLFRSRKLSQESVDIVDAPVEDVVGTFTWVMVMMLCGVLLVLSLAGGGAWCHVCRSACILCTHRVLHAFSHDRRSAIDRSSTFLPIATQWATMPQPCSAPSPTCACSTLPGKPLSDVQHPRPCVTKWLTA